MDAADGRFAATSFSELPWGSADESPSQDASSPPPKVVTSEEDSDELHSALEDAESEEDERSPPRKEDDESGISTDGVPAEAEATLRESDSDDDDSDDSLRRDRHASGGANDGREFPVEEEEDDDEFSTSGVPDEVTLHESDNDNDDSDSNRDSDDETELDAEESDAELDDGDEVELDEDSDECEEEDDNAVDNSSSECETDDEGSVDSERSEDDYDRAVDDASCCSAPSLSDGLGDGRRDGEDPQRHRLFLPPGVPPFIESLKYKDDESSDEDNDAPSYLHGIMVGRGGQPRMWDGRPSSATISSESDCSSDEGSRPSKKRKRASRMAGVSFNDRVTVHSIYHSKAYPPSMVRRIYTKQEELRVNKIRNKKEFAYDSLDWRNATEEEDFETDGEGELLHPVHFIENSSWSASPSSVAQMSTRGRYQGGTKRMRIHRSQVPR